MYVDGGKSEDFSQREQGFYHWYNEKMVKKLEAPTDNRYLLSLPSWILIAN